MCAYKGCCALLTICFQGAYIVVCLRVFLTLYVSFCMYRNGCTYTNTTTHTVTHSHTYTPTYTLQQVPPNLTSNNDGEWEALLNAGINDWGGVSPLTRDYVNPEAPWPHLERLAAATAAAGKVLVPR